MDINVYVVDGISKSANRTQLHVVTAISVALESYIYRSLCKDTKKADNHHFFNEISAIMFIISFNISFNVIHGYYFDIEAFLPH